MTDGKEGRDSEGAFVDGVEKGLGYMKGNDLST